MSKKPGSSGRMSDISSKETVTGGMTGKAGSPPKPAASPLPKALMKTSALKSSASKTSASGRKNGAAAQGRAAPASSAPAGKAAAPVDLNARQKKIEERVAAATEELASGITEAAAAAEELRRALEQIASGANEAASAAQESLAVTAATAASLARARDRAETAGRRTEALQTLIADTSAQIVAWATNIKHSGERQARSVTIMEELSRHAASIADVTKTVTQISDQTNLLALNAAIEAARAGDYGKGFAVVADEVRALAEASEKSALQTQGLASQIQNEVKTVASTIKSAANIAATEAQNSQTVTLALVDLRKDVAALTEGSHAIVGATQEAEAAAREAQKGAEIIASAAEEQAAAVTEALRSVEQQTSALEESEVATRSLSTLAADIGSESNAGGAQATQLASAAEQLSTAVQEVSGAADQIMTAVEQISRGGQQQASATQQASAALSQIEKMANTTKDYAAQSLGRSERSQTLLGEIEVTVARLADGLSLSVESTRQSLALVAALEAVNRKVEKIVDGIGMVSIQTNLLAVNGSVEAARAGEFGKGFAVVSKDIRNLARESGENAERIKDIVKTIQDQILAVRRELEQIVVAAETESQRTTAVRGSLDAVLKDIREVASNSQQIVESASTVLASISEASLAAQQVAAAAEQAGSASAEAAAAAKEQARGAEDLAAAIEEIASLAEEIQKRNGQ